MNIINSKTDSVVFERKFPKHCGLEEQTFDRRMCNNASRTFHIPTVKLQSFVCKLDNNDALVGSFPIEDGMRFHVIDNFQLFTETVEKFDLTEEQYNQKEDSLRSFLKKNKLGKYNEEEMKKIEEKRREAAEEEARKAAECKVGLRCQVIAMAVSS